MALSEADPDRPDRPGVDWVLAGRAFVRGRLQPIEIAIDSEGRIESVGKVRGGAPRRDVGDAVILPAATDLHVHLREPGGPQSGENIPSGTRQAALGGVTLVGNMPNTDPPIVDPESLEDLGRRVAGRAEVDVLLYAAVTRRGNLERLAESAGAFKLFLGPTTGIPEPASSEDLPGLLRRIAGVGLPLTVHAEDPSRFRATGVPRDPAEWDLHRPTSAEDAAIDRLLPPTPGLRLHVAHVTTAAAARRLRRAGVSCEVAPHHLFLSERSGSDPRFKVNPPLRSEPTREELWNEFRRGEIPCIASDHAPHLLEAKQLPFEKAPSGMPEVETMLPMLFARVRAGELDLPTLVAAACDRPARWFGQPLGRIAPGHRANLLVVDFKARSKVNAARLHGICGWTAYEGREAIFPREHYRDGERLVEGGEYVGRPKGTVVRPEFAPEPRGRPRGHRPGAEPA
jgi:dihydroorotase